jgi:hypothetical protein
MRPAAESAATSKEPSHSFKHNSSAVQGRGVTSAFGVWDGEPCVVVPTRILLDTSKSLGLRTFAAWAWGQALVSSDIQI